MFAFLVTQKKTYLLQSTARETYPGAMIFPLPQQADCLAGFVDDPNRWATGLLDWAVLLSDTTGWSRTGAVRPHQLEVAESGKPEGGEGSEGPGCGPSVEW
jgi:hypothetical protein